jgi:hypothetical protein
MSTKYHLKERIFLNNFPEMRAYIIAIIEDTREVPAANEDGWKHATIELKIADCYNDIALEFDLCDKERRENSLHKVRELARVIAAFRDALEIEAESIEERQAFMPLIKASSVVH